MQMVRTSFLAGSAVASFLACTPPAMAQTTAPLAQDATDNGEIVVTARRRDEKLQDVPEAITAFTAGDISKAGISNFRDVADLTPNLSQLDNYRPGLARFQVRGLITPQVGDPPLAFVFDGVTAPDAEFVNQELFDIERIEVLRGAQGALYGRGAVGGAVNIVTKQPTNDFSGNVQASYANGDSYRGSAVLSGPIVEDKIFFRAGGYYADSDGLIRNDFLDRKVDYIRDYSFFGLLKAELGASTTIDLRGRYGNTRAGVGYYQPVEESNFEDFSIGTSQNVLGIDQREIYEISAKLEHRFDFATLTAVAGYSKAKDDAFSDGDYTALPGDGATFFPGIQNTWLTTSAWTFEGRLTSTGTGPFTWAIGSFYQDRKRDSNFSFYDDFAGDEPVLTKTLDPAALLYAVIDDGGSKAWALSAQAGYDITEKLAITVAARYDHDRRRSVDPRDIAATAARATFEQFQPKFSLSYKVTPDVLFYAGYSRGFRSGGFNEYSVFTPRIYGKEVSDSYELGFKTSFLDRTVTLNGALFRIDQKNAQITQFNPDSFTLENLAIDAARSQGAEIELAVRPATGLMLRANFGYTDSEIRSFDDNPAAVGSAMPYISKYNGSVSADFETPIGTGLDLTLRADYKISGPRSFALELPDVRSGSHDFVGLRAGLRTEAWQLDFFVENLFNERQPEDIFVVGNGAASLVRQPNRPRSFGVQGRINF